MMLPTAPLLAALQARAQRDALSVDDLVSLLAIDRRWLLRLRHRATLREDAGDRWAVALGKHPSEIWPEWFGWPASRRAAGG